MKKYSIFESVERAHKILKKWLTFFPSKNIDDEIYNKFINKMVDEGLGNYLGNIFNNINFNNKLSDEDINNIISLVKEIKHRKLKIPEVIPNKKDNLSISDKLNFLVEKSKVISFIKKYSPSKIRKENVKYYENNPDVISYNKIKQIKKEAVKKGSRYNSSKEWFDFLIHLSKDDDLKRLKNSNIKIYHEDSEWLIYSPMDYESYLIPGYEYWCLMQKTLYDNYSRTNDWFGNPIDIPKPLINPIIIFHNKILKSDSYVGIYNGGMIEIFNYKNKELHQLSEEDIDENEDYILNFLNKKGLVVWGFSNYFNKKVNINRFTSGDS